MRRVAAATFGGFLAASVLLAVRIEEVRIPMKDGVRLAADIWRPDEGAGPFPVLLEYLPYRKTEARGGATPSTPTSSATDMSSPAWTSVGRETARAR